MDKVKFIKRSPVTQKKYDYFSNDIIRVLNLRQAMGYLNYGVELLDIYTSRDKDDNPVLVFVFDKESSKPAYDLWCKHELEI